MPEVWFTLAGGSLVIGFVLLLGPGVALWPLATLGLAIIGSVAAGLGYFFSERLDRSLLMLFVANILLVGLVLMVLSRVAIV